MSSFLPVLSYASNAKSELRSSDSGVGVSIVSADGTSTSVDVNFNPADEASGSPTVLSNAVKARGKNKARLATGKERRSTSSQVLSAQGKARSSSSPTTFADYVVERASQGDNVRSTKRSYAEAVRTVKKVVVALQLTLLEGVRTEAQLESSRALLTQAEYGDVVTERAISRRCGLPTCLNALPESQERQGRYRISLRERKVYDLKETSLFCSVECLIRSSTFSSTLRVERDVVESKDRLIRIVKAVRGLGLFDADRPVQSSVVLERPEERVESPISFGPSDAIEGHVPLISPQPYPDVLEDACVSGDVERNQDIEVTEAVPLPDRGSDAVEVTSQHPTSRKIFQEKRTGHAVEACRKTVGTLTAAEVNNESEEILNLAGFDTGLEIDGSTDRKSHSEGTVPVSTTKAQQQGIETPTVIEEENRSYPEKLQGVSISVPLVNHSEDVTELDDCEASDSWYDEPPAGFKVEVSTFGKIWQALDEWICAAAVAHVYGRDSSEEEKFTDVNGREYMRRKVAKDGLSAEIARTVATCLAQQLPHVTLNLRISVPISTVEQAIWRLLQTMTFVQALPPFGMKEWRMLAILFLDALSVYRLPVKSDQFANNVLRHVLESTGVSEVEYTLFREILLPAGRLPTSSRQVQGT